LAYF
jgi:hypothetical protein